MEVEIKDIRELKLSPSLIVFLKAIFKKDDNYLKELHNVSDLFIMGKHLEKLNMIKIVGNSISSNSFEIRRLGLLTYFEKLSDKEVLNEQIDEVIDYFKKVTGKTRTSNTSVSNRKFIASRLQEYTVKDLKDVIDLKYNQWKNDFKMKDYIRIETFFNETKFQGYIGQLESNDLKDFSDDI